MTTEVFRIDSYDFAESDVLFVDTNIWFYIYAPQVPDDWKTRVYSKALAKMLTAKCRIFIDALVLSEFINRYARLTYQLSTGVGSTINFKEYRRSPDFKPVAKEIVSSVRRMLKHCQRTESGFSSGNIDQVLSEFGEGDSDFNDQLMIELCKNNGFKLITHDHDFKECGLTVLTANNKMLDFQSKPARG